MEQEISGIVQFFNTKYQGTSKNTGKPFTIYAVTINGQEFTTFDKEWQEKLNQPVTHKFKLVQNGQYTDYRLAPLEAARPEPAYVKRLEDKLDLLLSRSATPAWDGRETFSDGTPVPDGPEGEINIEDIDFSHGQSQ